MKTSPLPSVSIIIPVYGAERYIERCLNSVAKQTYQGEVECLIVDDRGPDRSAEIAEKWVEAYRGKTEFRILHHDVNRGVSAARNTALEEASGDYVYILDSDDELPYDALSNLVGCVEAHPGVDLVLGQMYPPPSEPSLYFNFDKDYYEGDTARRQMLRRDHTTWQAANKLIRRSLLTEKALHYQTGIKGEDDLFTFFLARSISSMAVTQKPTYVYYLNPSSIMHTLDRESFHRDIVRVHELQTEALTSELGSAQVSYILHSLLDFDIAIRYGHADPDVASDPLLSRIRALIPCLRRHTSNVLLLVSLAIFSVEMRSPMHLSSRLLMPFHRASKMFAKLYQKFYLR